MDNVIPIIPIDNIEEDKSHLQRTPIASNIFINDNDNRRRFPSNISSIPNTRSLKRTDTEGKPLIPKTTKVERRGRTRANFTPISNLQVEDLSDTEPLIKHEDIVPISERPYLLEIIRKY